MRTSELPNIGPVLEGHLRAAGIETAEQLRGIGAEEAFCRVRASAKPDACLHELEALAGAVEGIRKSLLPQARKAALRRYFMALNQTQQEKRYV